MQGRRGRSKTDVKQGGAILLVQGEAEKASRGLGGRQQGLQRRKIRPVLAVSGAEEDGNGFPVDRGRSGTATVELRGNDDLL